MKKLDILDIEDILYEGSKEEIERIMKEYQISYEFSNNNFKFQSMRLNEISNGYKTEIIPNCVKYFGQKY